LNKVSLTAAQLRKRSPDFPSVPGAVAEFAQPAALPHCDFSPRGSLIRVSEVLPKEEFAGKEFDMLKWVPYHPVKSATVGFLTETRAQHLASPYWAQQRLAAGTSRLAIA
jgi:hypothetical protein